LQEYLPASKRGWVSGLSISLIPAGGLLSAILSAYLGTIIGWRGLFAIGMLPALMAFVIRIWVPESPRWLIGQGRIEEARRSLAWALHVDPGAIALPAALPETRKVPWRELFKYPRSLDAIVPGFNYFAVWFLLPVFVFLFIGIETKGRTIEELDAALTGPVPTKAAAQ
jgi:MFS family permease